MLSIFANIWKKKKDDEALWKCNSDPSKTIRTIGISNSIEPNENLDAAAKKIGP
jgi:hypothetical protein